jgi:hypothetical protein
MLLHEIIIGYYTVLCTIWKFITYLVQIKAFLYDQYDRKKTVHIFTPRENNRLLDYYKIISISRSILARVNMGLDFASDQYGCLFSRCRKYVINSLIHWHFHIGLVIIPRPILARDGVEDQYGSRDDNQANMEMPMY